MFITTSLLPDCASGWSLMVSQDLRDEVEQSLKLIDTERKKRSVVWQFTHYAVLRAVRALTFWSLACQVFAHLCPSLQLHLLFLQLIVYGNRVDDSAEQNLCVVCMERRKEVRCQATAQSCSHCRCRLFSCHVRICAHVRSVQNL